MNDKQTPLFVAVETNNYKIAKLLIDNNANVNQKLDDVMLGYTPLHTAIYHENYEICELLITSKANVELTDAYGTTPENLLRNSNISNLLKLV